ncbi:MULTISPECIES: histidine kinase [unclassified Tolypothrix]|nr:MULTISPECIES: histidine kinase [unclassified Tolypothrix]UYD31560.1 histidine kinase [Tolypothrix sp. PCC 7601]
MGNRYEGDEGKLLPMPNAQCPMPNAQYPMPNTQCPIPSPSQEF